MVRRWAAVRELADVERIERRVWLDFALVLLAVLAIGILTLVDWYWLALTVGVVAGAIFFLQGMAAGGSLGNARHLGQDKADVSTRLGICLAAMGIAAAAVGNEHYPMSFRVFYGVCLVGAALIALVLAARALSKEKPTPRP